MARKKRVQERDIQAENRKHVLRDRKERRERQLLLAVLVPVLAVVLAVVAYGAYQELFLAPRTPVARVEGATITASQFAPRVQWYRRQMLNNLQSLIQIAQSSDPSFLTNLAEQQRTGAADATVDQLIDEVLVRKEDERRGITVTETDIDKRIVDDLSTVIAPPTSEPAVEVTVGPGTGTPVTATAAVTMTSTPISTQRVGEEFRTMLQPVLDQVGLSVSAYRDIVRNSLYREKLGESLEPEVQKQIEAAYMRFTSKETAQQAADMLAGGASWEEVTQQFQQPTATPEPTGEAVAAATPAEGTARAEATPAEAATQPEATATELPTEVPPTETATEVPPTSSVRNTAVPTKVEATATRRTAATASVTAGAASTTATVPSLSIGGQLTATQGITIAGQTAGVVARPTAGATASLAAPTSATPATPTATPEPYASTIGEKAWLTRDDIKQQWGLSDTDIDAVMALPKGKWGGPYSAAGDTYYVVYVSDVAEQRKIEKDRLQTLRDQAVNDWLTKRKEEVKPDKFPIQAITPAEPQWFLSAWDSLFPTANVTPAVGTLAMPTVFSATAAPGSEITGTGAVTTTGATQ